MLSKQNFKYKGDFDFRALINFIKDWYENKQYTFSESKYKEKPSDHGLEIEMDVKGTKKVDEYVRHSIMVAIHVWDMNSKEVTVDNHKKMINTGRLQITFEYKVETDWQGQYKDTESKRKFKNFFDKKIINMDLGVIHDDALYYEMQRFMNDVKAKLGMVSAQNAY